MPLRAITALLAMSSSAWAQETDWTALLPTVPEGIESIRFQGQARGRKSDLGSGEWRLGSEGLVGKTTGGETAVFRIPGDFWDFELELEFFTPDSASGGVQFRSHWLPAMPAAEGEASPRKRIHGYRTGIDTRAKGGTAGISDSGRRGVLSAPSKDSEDMVKASEWNSIRISAIGPIMEVAINGATSARVFDERFIGGFVALLVEPLEGGKPGEIHFRNLRVRDLGRGGDWRSLFNGTSLRGWKNWGAEDFSVSNGTIQARRGPKESEGYLATEERWTNFRVRGEFRMLGDGNYGLFYHSTIRYRNDGYPLISGVQGEVMPGRPAETGRLYESYRRGWLVDKDHADIGSWALREGEWNAIQIRSQGNHVTTWVNGIRVVDFFDASPQLFEGSFALQLHTGEGSGIDWRELYVLDN